MPVAVPVLHILFFQSLASGVAHPASSFVLRLLQVSPASLFPFCAGVAAIGVGHPVRLASWLSAPPA